MTEDATKPKDDIRASSAYEPVSERVYAPGIADKQEGQRGKNLLDPQIAFKYIKDAEDTKKDLQQVKDLLEKSKVTNVEVLAIFVAFFTFISLEFQLIRGLNYIDFMFLSTFFSGVLILFALVIHTLLHNEWGLKVTIFTTLSLLLMLASAWWISNESNLNRLGLLDKNLTKELENIRK